MGFTFVAALLKKTTTAPGTRKDFRLAMEALGYRKAANVDEASLSLRMYQDKKSAWLSMAMDIPESLNDELELLRKVAEEMHTPILYFMNLDSDFLYIAATDGEKVQHVHVGFLDEDDDEAVRDSDDLSIFDALLPDDEARAEFRRILAMDDEERVFSEEAAQEMAALFGYTPEVLFIDEDAKPFAELCFDLPGKEAVPFFMPEDAPAALRVGSMGLGNPSDVAVFSNGGVGKGIRVVLRADGYDAQDWELPVMQLRKCVMQHPGQRPEIFFDEKVVPKRVNFQDGSSGWIAEFPDAPIYRGVNPASPQEYSKKGYDYHFEHAFTLSMAFLGGTFQERTLVRPAPSILTDPNKRVEWLIQRREQMLEVDDGDTAIWIFPMQNPEKAAHGSIPRKPFRKDIPHDWLRGYWPDDEM
ncbi:MAG: hypothetical protein IJA83_02535 [Clostridia bacterium]|nr:hypothetical protein [Clostridia bacterium]